MTGPEPGCVATTRTGWTCGKPSLPYAPFPICLHHGSELYQFVNRMMRHGASPAAAATQTPYREPEPRPPLNEVVYYLQIGPLIKIGTTGNLKTRLSAYPAIRHLLATEPGGAGLEGQRLYQFRHLLHVGREWFRIGDALCDHIDDLRREAGDRPMVRSYTTE